MVHLVLLALVSMPTATTATIMHNVLNASLGITLTRTTLALLSLRAQLAIASFAQTLMEPSALAAIPISHFQVTTSRVLRLLHAPMALPSMVLLVLVLMEPTVLDMLAHLAQVTVFFAHQPLPALHALPAISSALEHALLVEVTARLALMPPPARFVKADSHC